jgi:transcriptional antiterminator Rof (Rho-off)
MYFEATGKTMELRLDKVEKFFEECQGDETRHPEYGMF